MINYWKLISNELIDLLFIKSDGYDPNVYKYIGSLNNNNDKFNGKGICFYINGNKYDGNWLNSKMDGYGKLEMFNGDKYIIHKKFYH